VPVEGLQSSQQLAVVSAADQDLLVRLHALRQHLEWALRQLLFLRGFGLFLLLQAFLNHKCDSYTKGDYDCKATNDKLPCVIFFHIVFIPQGLILIFKAQSQSFSEDSALKVDFQQVSVKKTLSNGGMLRIFVFMWNKKQFAVCAIEAHVIGAGKDEVKAGNFL
jgi:hypothetical protein